jgi:ubiquinone/menaquinone biosynthesis C-methylase UbiE
MNIDKEFNPNLLVSGYIIRKRILKGVADNVHFLNGKMLDFGCGSKPYKSLFNVEEYIGLDYDSQGHDHSNEQIDVFYDGVKIPFDDNTFDSVFSSEVFEHVFNLEEMIPEINRVMKVNGVILITCPFAICEHEQPNDYARYTSFAIKHLMQKNGFEVIKYEKIGSSIDVIFQLSQIYFHKNIVPYFSKIPIIRKVLRLTVILILNIIGSGLNFIFPKGEELYLNNLIVCKKIK